jgi:hypothetical protein
MGITTFVARKLCRIGSARKQRAGSQNRPEKSETLQNTTSVCSPPTANCDRAGGDLTRPLKRRRLAAFRHADEAPDSRSDFFFWERSLGGR